MSAAPIIQCPGCKEYISSDAVACRFCQRFVDKQTRQAAEAAQEAERRAEHKSQSFKTMLLGLAMMAGGIAITGVTYALAASSRDGGLYLIMWGPIIFGGLRFVQGLMGWAGGK